MTGVKIKILSKPSKRMAAAYRQVWRGVFENSPVPNEPSKYLYIEVADDSGKLIGVLNGDTLLGWFNIWGLWVDKQHRGKGLGTSIVKAAEIEAKRRKCKKVFVSSLDFQSPGFYRKCGYKKYGMVKNALMGNTMHYFQKDL